MFEIFHLKIKVPSSLKYDLHAKMFNLSEIILIKD